MRKSGSYIKTEIAVSEIDTKLVPVIGSKANPYIIYLKMKSKIVRDGWIDHEGFPIKEKYYDNGLLAMTMSIRQMTEEFGVAQRSVSKAIRVLKEMGWIGIDKLKTRNSFKPQNVYTFGFWEKKEGGRIVETFFNSPLRKFV